MDPRSNFRRWDAPSSGSTKLAAKTEATRLDAVSFPFELNLGGVEAMLRGSIPFTLIHSTHNPKGKWIGRFKESTKCLKGRHRL